MYACNSPDRQLKTHGIIVSFDGKEVNVTDTFFILGSNPC